MDITSVSAAGISDEHHARRLADQFADLHETPYVVLAYGDTHDFDVERFSDGDSAGVGHVIHVAYPGDDAPIPDEPTAHDYDDTDGRRDDR